MRTAQAQGKASVSLNNSEVELKNGWTKQRRAKSWLVQMRNEWSDVRRRLFCTSADAHNALCLCCFEAFEICTNKSWNIIYSWCREGKSQVKTFEWLFKLSKLEQDYIKAVLILKSNFSKYTWISFQKKNLEKSSSTKLINIYKKYTFKRKIQIF